MSQIHTHKHVSVPRKTSTTYQQGTGISSWDMFIFLLLYTWYMSSQLGLLQRAPRFLSPPELGRPVHFRALRPICLIRVVPIVGLLMTLKMLVAMPGCVRSSVFLVALLFSSDDLFVFWDKRCSEKRT